MFKSRLQGREEAVCARLIEKACVPFQNDLLHYRLLDARRYHMIEVTLGEETVLLPVGNRSVALRLYEKVKKGLVTPCTATYIFEDFAGGEGLL